MTIDDYKRNLRGVNDKRDFDPDYLVSESFSARADLRPIFTSPSRDGKSSSQRSMRDNTALTMLGRA